MQQLWLNNKRIDSISDLRLTLSNAEDDLKEELYIHILELFKSGALCAWLYRQEELSSITEHNFKDAIKPLLNSDNSSITPTQYKALSILCEVPAEYFTTEEVQKNIQSKDTLINGKLEKLRRQSWWEKHRDLLETVKDWNLVVLNQSELELALGYLRGKDLAAASAPYVLYLCNTEQMEKKSYTLNLINIKNITIYRLGEPKVIHTRISEPIDADKMNIKLIGFDLYCTDGQSCIT